MKQPKMLEQIKFSGERIMPLTVTELSAKLDQIHDIVSDLKRCYDQTRMTEENMAKDLTDMADDQKALRRILTGPDGGDGLVMRVDRIERVVAIIKWVAVVTLTPMIASFVAAIIWLLQHYNDIPLGK